MTRDNLLPPISTFLLIALGSSLLMPVKAYGFTITQNPGKFLNPIPSSGGSNQNCLGTAVCSGINTDKVTFGTPVGNTIPTFLQYIPVANINGTVCEEQDILKCGNQIFTLGEIKFQNGFIDLSTIITNITLRPDILLNAPELNISNLPLNNLNVPIQIDTSLNSTGDAVQDRDFIKNSVQAGQSKLTTLGIGTNFAVPENQSSTVTLKAVVRKNTASTFNNNSNQLLALDNNISDITFDLLGFGEITQGIAYVTDIDGIVVQSTDPQVVVGTDITPSIPEGSNLSALLFLAGLGMLTKRKNNELV